MMKNIAVIGMAVLLVGGVAAADVVDGDFPGERYQLQITKEAGIGTCECLDRYTFQVQDQGSGLPINSLDVTVSGPGLHHEQFDLAGQRITPQEDTIFGLISPIDTVILLDWAGLSGNEPTEPLVSDNSCEPESGTWSLYSPVTGYGSPLTGVVVELASPAATPVDVLQVVNKCGEAFDYSVRVSNDAGAGETFAGRIPEPATLGLLCLGGLALIRRRRR